MIPNSKNVNYSQIREGYFFLKNVFINGNLMSDVNKTYCKEKFKKKKNSSVTKHSRRYLSLILLFKKTIILKIRVKEKQSRIAYSFILFLFCHLALLIVLATWSIEQEILLRYIKKLITLNSKRVILTFFLSYIPYELSFFLISFQIVTM